MIEKIFDAPISRISAFLMFVIGTLSPAMLFLAVYRPEFFLKTDFSKLLIVSNAVAMPLFLA